MKRGEGKKEIRNEDSINSVKISEMDSCLKKSIKTSKFLCQKKIESCIWRMYLTYHSSSYLITRGVISRSHPLQRLKRPGNRATSRKRYPRGRTKPTCLRRDSWHGGVATNCVALMTPIILYYAVPRTPLN